MTTTLDHTKLEEYAQQVGADVAAAASGALVVLGDRLGLYRALADCDSVTSHEFAQQTGFHERYLREWLCAQAAAGYVTYNGENETFSLSPEQRAVFVDEMCPAFMPSAFQSVASLYTDEPKLAEVFRSNEGLPWGDHSTCLLCGTERVFGTQYRNFLIDSWIPALDGVLPKLERGARVADVGCGHGVSTVIMAQAFPNSTFIGYDYHKGSIERARELAQQHDLSNLRFEVSDASSFPGENYDLIAMFDCLHDLGDPLGACKHVKNSLAGEGAFLIVEPLAGDTLEENMNPLGQMYYSFSTMACVPGSMSQKVGAALGAQAGEARLRKVLNEAGFSRVRRVAETPNHMVLEARA